MEQKVWTEVQEVRQVRSGSNRVQWWGSVMGLGTGCDSAWLPYHSLFQYKPQILSLINQRHLASSSGCWSITLPKPSPPLLCTCPPDSRSDLIGPTGPVGLGHGHNSYITSVFSLGVRAGICMSGFLIWNLTNLQAPPAVSTICLIVLGWPGLGGAWRQFFTVTEVCTYTTIP